MVANIFRIHPLDPKGQKIEIHIFQNMVMLTLKLKGIMKAAAW